MFTYKPPQARIPIKVWMQDITCLDDKTLEQLFNLSRLPFAFKHIVQNADGHSGYGMPIGGVLATKNVIVPYAVGSDIACGMCAVRTSVRTETLTREILLKILMELRRVIPVGFRGHNTPQIGMPDYVYSDTVVGREFNRAEYKLGTLGSGNHFLELQKADDGYLWVMIHSGSRNLGYKVCDYYNKLAIELNDKWHSQIPKEWELAFLPFDSEEGQNYFKEMNYCVEYAFANRKLMMDRAIQVIADILDSPFTFDPMINVAHNYAALENHYGENVLVHRKGATRARLGEIGIVPGSQGDFSYIVKGLGNPESFMSCSHGAGRKLGRKQAIRKLSLEDEQHKLNELGVIHSVRGKNSLDEAPGAYKPIEEVMNNQKDLVEIVMRLQPLAVLKGN
jgi:tRNA-splicing ligase RtcB